MRPRNGVTSRVLNGSLHRMSVIGAVVTTVLLGTVGQGFAAPRVDDVDLTPPKVAAVKAAKKVHSLPVKHRGLADAASTPYRANRKTWPAAKTVTVTPKPGVTTAAAGTPIRLKASTGTGAVTVTSVGHGTADKAGIHGTIFTLTAKAARNLTVTADYNGFANAEGGNFGSRLHLVALPACVLTTPAVPACQAQTGVAAKNDTTKSTVAGAVTLTAGATRVLALSTADTTKSVAAAAAAAATPADGGSPGGSYQATTLSPTGSWAQGGSSGSFSYSYPIAVPPSRSQLQPDLSLSYDSASVDGKTSSSQAQAGWAGDGWSTPSSFIEWTYTSCSDNPEGTAAPTKTSDLCYDGPIVTMSLNGGSSELVRDDTTKEWHERFDNGSVITQTTKSDIANGTYDNDYWKVTTRDGTTYHFGLNHLPGWATGKAVTNSVQTVPVFSAHKGDPCYQKTAATWAGSVCTMGYRWNLDYVTDVHGNAMSYYYGKDTNFYGQNAAATMARYDRDSYLKEIQYGFADGQAYGNVANKVVFTTGPRCFTGTCTSLTSTTAPNFPDVPFDAICASGAKCKAQSPAFFSTVRLTSITTQQYDTTASTPGYQTVDSYALTETIPSAKAGDSAAPTLWLSKITRTGSDQRAGGSKTAITMPSVGFTAIALQNRVDTTTVVLPPLYRNRISAVTTESGGVIGVDYGLTKPCSASSKPTPASNTKSCFPVRWTPAGSATVDDWFNRYAVTGVTEYDATGGSVAKATSYSYGDPAWHYDDNEVVKKKYRSYGQFHGYATVTTYTGDGVNDVKTKHVTSYYQGMSRNNSTTVRNVTDSQGGAHEDKNELQGKVLEDTTYQGDGGPVDASTVTSYWVSGASASRSRTTASLPALESEVVAPVLTWTRQRVTSGSSTTWRVTAADTSYDGNASSSTYGLARYAYMHTVPVDPDYDSCTVTSYAPVNAGKNLVGLAGQTETDSVACGSYTAGSPTTVPAEINGLGAPASVKRPDQVKSATRTYYDGATSLTAVPSEGQPTMVEEAVDYTGGAFVWKLKGKTGYDTYGRTTSATDGNNYTTRTEYTDDAYGLVTAVKVTNPLNQSAIQTMDPARGQVLTSTDANQVKATVQFDTLGRITGAWTESRDPATTTPNASFVYNVSQTGVTYVTSKKMNSTGGFIVSTKLYDSLLRERQTQSPSPKGGRVVADTFYDSRGWVKARNNRWWDSATTPNGQIVSSDTLAAAVPSGDTYYYDGLGRVIADESTNNGQVVSTTHTVYNGDRSTTFPAQAGDHTRAFPADTAGGTVETTLTDPIGRTTELRQYTSAPTVTAPANSFTGTYAVSGGSYTKTRYGFDGHGLQSTVADDAGNTWTTSYDLIGQTVAKTDPVAGTSTTKYDGVGNVIETTDAANHTISYAYDKINRKTDEWSAPVASRTDADKTGHWEYDSTTLTYGIGHVASTTTYVDGSAYVNASTNFNIFGESLGETVTIPAREGALAGTYTYTHQYESETGLKIRDTYPAVAAAGLPKETLTRTYSGFLDLPDALTGLEADTSYDAYGRIDQATLGGGNNVSFVTNIYDDHTNAVLSRSVTRASTATQRNVETHTYDYDVLGRITSETQSRLGATDTSETRCYRYDLVQRLTAAWTATDKCAATPSSASHGSVGDPLDAKAAYWTTWAYDAIGRRTNQTQHAIGDADSEASTDYAYTSTKQPLTLSSATTATATPQPDGGTKTVTTAATYTYDDLGNLKTRTGTDHGDQTLDWTADGKLSAVTSTTKGKSDFTYDAGGALLSQHDPDSWTLYLPDGQLKLNTGNSTISGVRYYALPGGDTAHRTGSGTAYGFDLADQHGTVELALDNTAQNPTWRAFTPFGETRGEAAAWHDNRTFLNKPADDTTGFVNIGDRYYDASTGSFISLDPVLEPDDPQQLSGYAYAANNPILNADPTGQSVYREPDRSSNAPIPTTSNNTTGGNSTNSNGNGSTQGNDGSTGQTHTKKKHWWERGWDWVVENQNTIAGVVAGVGTFALCEGASVGVGTIGCMAAAGAAGKLTTDYLNGDIHNASDAITSTVEGAAEGVLAVPLAAVDLVGQGKAIANDVKEGDYAGAVGHGILAGLDAATVVGGVKAARGCANSFVPGTLVLLANGTRKAIENLTLQDQVAAADPTTGDQKPEPVSALIKGKGQKQLVKIGVDTNGDGSTDSYLTATSNHPVWNDDSRTWIDGGSLLPGQHLLTPGGKRVTVRQLLQFEQDATVYNLTVDALHTYYVLVGTTPVLVHNCIGTAVNKSTGLSSGELEGAAIQARDGLATQLSRTLSSRKLPNVAIGGYNKETGKYAAFASSSEGCAETCLINALGGDSAKVVRTTPVLLRKTNFLSPRAVCISCELTWGRDNVSPETTFESDWLRVNDPN